jgi:1,4-alpha-glucan branching enzyme
MTPAGSPIAELLQRWLPGQRWFADKGGVAPQMRRVGGIRLQDPDGEVGIEILLLGVLAGADGGADGGVDEGAGEARWTTVYQVPLTYRGAPVQALAAALVGTFEHATLGPRWVYDGPHDPAFVRAWLRLVADGEAAFADQGPAFGTARGVRQPGGLPIDPDAPARVLRGEQSNTSVIVGADGPAPAIVKIFRVLAAGDNPDVVVQSALAAAGCERVPRPVGWVEAEWPGPDGGTTSGHLAFAAEFLAGSEDAWRVACRAVESDASFAAQARDLGVATAQVHAAMAAALPTAPATRELLDDLADGLLDRVGWAVAQAPVLADREAAARRAVAAVAGVGEGLVLQQVHGDYHLGQVLHSPERGWVLLDFEGEPLRPLAERLVPDLALRDVAGMLRSFDYAARHATMTLPDGDPRVAAADAWADACREAFLDGYAEAAGRDPRADGPLLRALELDKALYEVVYETRNRPGWVAVPLHAVRRLLALD